MNFHPNPRGTASLLVAAVLGAGAGLWAAVPFVLSTIGKLCEVLAYGPSALFLTKGGANDFLKRSENCVIITNKTMKAWKFGYLSQRDSELQLKQSGTFKWGDVSYAMDDYSDHGVLAADAAPVELPRNFGAIILKPMCKKTGAVYGWEKLFRVCYLQDEAGNRIYLNITKDTADSAVPTVGIAAVSLRSVMAAKALEIYNTPKLFKESRLKKINMIAICVDSLDAPRK